MLRSRFLWKLFAVYAVLIVVTTIVLGLSIGRTIEHRQVDQIRRRLEAQATLLEPVARPHLTAAAIDSTFQHRVWVLGARTYTRLTVIRADGVVLADSRENPAAMDNHRMRPEVLEAVAKGVGSSTRFSHTLGHDMMYVAVAVHNGDNILGFVRASVLLTYVEETIRNVRTIVTAGALASIVLTLLIGFLIARGVTRPLMEMTEAADAVAAGDYDQHVHVAGSDEIGHLARSLNAMTAQLRNQIDTISADRAKTLAILGGMVEGVIAIDRQERIVHINSAAEAILGISSENSMGRRIWEATRVREVCDSLADAMKTQSLSIAEARIPSAKEEQVIQTIATPLRDTAGTLDGAIVVLHDVSALRQLEQVRRDFIANISHELKTPLAAIRGLVETLIDDPDMDDATHDRFLEKIREQSSRLSNLVVDLLTISRLESDEPGLEFHPMDLRGPVAESCRVLAPVAEAAGLSIEAHVPDVPVGCRGDAEALREMIDNLVSNAIKYTPGGGKVDVRLEVDGHTAVLEVEDSGIGIAPEDQGRIFERFYRVDKARSRQMGGTGLGLSIVKHVALAHGGNVSLRSETGRGSTFRVQIPINLPRETAAAAEPEQG